MKLTEIKNLRIIACCFHRRRCRARFPVHPRNSPAAGRRGRLDRSSVHRYRPDPSLDNLRRSVVTLSLIAALLVMEISKEECRSVT